MREDFQTQINEKMDTIFSDYPIESGLALSKQAENIDDPDKLLTIRTTLKDYMKSAQIQVSIPLTKPERKTLRLSYLEVETSYKKLLTRLLQLYAEATNDVKQLILAELDISEFNSLEDKRDFVAFLEEHTDSFPSLKEKEVKDLVQQQLGSYLLNRAKSPNDLKKSLTLLNLISFKRLRTDDQDIVAEVLLSNDKELLDRFDEELITKKIEGYKEDISELISSLNNTTTTQEVSSSLSRIFQDEWDTFSDTEKKDISLQFLLKVSIRPYKSLMNIRNDLNKAHENKLVSEKALNEHPHFFTSTTEGVYRLSSYDSDKERTFVRASNSTKSPNVADTITIID